MLLAGSTFNGAHLTDDGSSTPKPLHLRASGPVLVRAEQRVQVQAENVDVRGRADLLLSGAGVQLISAGALGRDPERSCGSLGVGPRAGGPISAACEDSDQGIRIGVRGGSWAVPGVEFSGATIQPAAVGGYHAALGHLKAGNGQNKDIAMLGMGTTLTGHSIQLQGSTEIILQSSALNKGVSVTGGGLQTDALFFRGETIANWDASTPLIVSSGEDLTLGAGRVVVHGAGLVLAAAQSVDIRNEHLRMHSHALGEDLTLPNPNPNPNWH